MSCLTVALALGIYDTFTTNEEALTMDSYARIINDFTMLPLRAILESIGYELGWQGETRTVIISTSKEESEPDTAQPYSHYIVGTWTHAGLDFYVFNDDGTGAMINNDIGLRWDTQGGIIRMCITPEICDEECLTPHLWAWFYEIEGNTLRLTRYTNPEEVRTFTRR